MPSTSAQVPRSLHQRLAAFLAREQANDFEHRPTRLTFVSNAVLNLPDDADQLRVLWSQYEGELTLSRRDNPGVKRPIQLTDDAQSHLLAIYATLVEADQVLQKQQLISLAIAVQLSAS